jgi:hypothetical protein
MKKKICQNNIIFGGEKISVTELVKIQRDQWILQIKMFSLQFDSDHIVMVALRLDILVKYV